MNKDREWQLMADKVDKMTDGLAMPVDEGIKDLVIVCNLLGLPTRASCEGHVDWALGGPYIHFCAPDNEQYQKRYDELQNEIGASDSNGQLTTDRAKQDEYYESEKFKSISRERDIAEAKIFAEALDYLHQFYASRERKPFIAIQLAGFSLESEGVCRFPALTKKQKQEFLEASQAEFRAFRDFLVTKWRLRS